ncbi:MAG: TetR/AcrR family transcriptional regulator [Alphaproteobacteria bacterium]|nr:TetR/AcrR family transcriptional regulator [Alphaproteobacteria bacterium]
MPATDQPKPRTTPDRLLDVAEHYIRQVGFHAFSFRDLATETGIKSASVHHHFPTKAALGVALVQRYRQRILAALEPLDDQPPSTALAALIAAHRTTLTTLDGLCIAGMLGAEEASLPPEVASETRAFFQAILTWLTRVFTRLGTSDPSAEARRLLAAIHGAMILARSLDDPTMYDTVVAPWLGKDADAPSLRA